MKPDSNKETVYKIDNEKTTTQIGIKSHIAQKVREKEEFYKLNYRQRISAVLGHVPDYCLMCSNHKWKLDGNLHYMGLGAFTHHLTSMMGSNGQRLNKEIIEAMYHRYREIIYSLRRTSTEANRPCQNVIFTIGVLT